MLFAIAGSQGSGKSSVLRELENRGYRVMQRKISRSVLADWDVTLEEVNGDLDLSLRFQDEVVLRKMEDEKEAVNSPQWVFTERTYMDSFVYYMFTFGCHESLSQNITDYYALCAEHNQSYKGVFFLPSGKFPTVADGVRGMQPQYVESVDLLLSHYTDQTIQNLHHVQELSVKDRVGRILYECGRLS